MQYTNYKYATPSGNRCAVFARPTGVGLKRTEVFILECSRKDMFSKKRAREAYETYIRSGGMECFYTTCHYFVDRQDGINFPAGRTVKVHQCHPLVITLPVPFSNEAITSYLKSFLKTFISRQTLNESIRETMKHWEEQGYVFEKPRTK